MGFELIEGDDQKWLYRAAFKLAFHGIKKNNRPIHLNKATGQRFPGKSPQLRLMENYLVARFKEQGSALADPIDQYVRAEFKFYFKDYYTKKGAMSMNLPDLSNLYELPQDCLTMAGIIDDDHLICAHDGSRRMPGKENWLEVILWPYEICEDWAPEDA